MACCRTASEAEIGELTARDFKLYEKVLSIINIKMKVGCTGCGYCMPCPKGVDIPGTFSSYNMCASEGYISSLRDHLMNTALRQNCTGALNCVECGRCEKHCPQHIEIRKELKFTSLRFNRLDDMIEATGLEKCKLCTYCWDGEE